MSELQRDCFYWIKGPDGEPEPAKWDGDGWVLLGGGELDDAELARETILAFEPDPPVLFAPHLKP